MELSQEDMIPNPQLCPRLTEIEEEFHELKEYQHRHDKIMKLIENKMVSVWGGECEKINEI